MTVFRDLLLKVLASFPKQVKSSVCWKIVKYTCHINAFPALCLNSKYFDPLKFNILLLGFSEARIDLCLFLLIQWEFYHQLQINSKAESSISFKILCSAGKKKINYPNIFINFKQKYTVNVFYTIRRLRRPKFYLKLFPKSYRNVGVHCTQGQENQMKYLCLLNRHLLRMFWYYYLC